MAEMPRHVSGSPGSNFIHVDTTDMFSGHVKHPIVAKPPNFKPRCGVAVRQ